MLSLGTTIVVRVIQTRRVAAGRRRERRSRPRVGGCSSSTDFALGPMTREERRDMYQVFVEPNARATTIVTSNRDTFDGTATLDDPSSRRARSTGSRTMPTTW